jgi:WD40 repeat protein
VLLYIMKTASGAGLYNMRRHNQAASPTVTVLSPAFIVCLQAQVDIGMPSHAVDFSQDGAHLAVGSTNGTIKVLNAADMNQLVAQVRRMARLIGHCSCCRYCAYAALMASRLQQQQCTCTIRC